MKYRLLVRRRAKAGVRRAARWYELRRPGLGRDFVAQVDAALNLVAANPLQYQVLHRETRRTIVHRFPYGAFYRIEADQIIVFCVIDLRQDPATWKSRIPK
ncbi:MAG: type II toxin-antitoxin system RelE/ParE family toxin [Betaproteobacteria bacterium]|nr:type II toxin-antitoxin system RelE/ParE family toxin [Betaproteobacteria bacterium]